MLTEGDMNTVGARRTFAAVEISALDDVCGGTRLTAMAKGAALGVALVSPYIAWSDADQRSKVTAGAIGVSWGSVVGLAARWAFKGTKYGPWRVVRGVRP